MINITQSGLETMFKGEEKPEGYDSAMRYISETPVNEDEYLRFRISERFNRILRDVYNHHSSAVNKDFINRMAESKMLSSSMLKALERIKSGELVVNDFEDALKIVLDESDVDFPDLSDAELNEWYEKENIIGDLFMKLPRSDLEVMACGDKDFVDGVMEMKKAKALASQKSFKPPAQHRGGQRKGRNK